MCKAERCDASRNVANLHTSNSAQKTIFQAHTIPSNCFPMYDVYACGGKEEKKRKEAKGSRTTNRSDRICFLDDTSVIRATAHVSPLSWRASTSISTANRGSVETAVKVDNNCLALPVSREKIFTPDNTRQGGSRQRKNLRRNF